MFTYLLRYKYFVLDLPLLWAYIFPCFRLKVNSLVFFKTYGSMLWGIFPILYLRLHHWPTGVNLSSRVTSELHWYGLLCHCPVNSGVMWCHQLPRGWIFYAFFFLLTMNIVLLNLLCLLSEQPHIMHWLLPCMTFKLPFNLNSTAWPPTEEWNITHLIINSTAIQLVKSIQQFSL